ncbi:MAG TPA: DUF4870 domain-containing protein [Flavobacteriaceae bacterium]|nr:DUF4870 domain-containing protein [Flavobacteriaceae bacterium]
MNTNDNYMREDKQFLMLTHLSQLLNYLTGFGGLIVPLILWSINKDNIIALDQQGRAIVNFQISLFLYSLISIPLIFIFGIGVFLLIAIWIVGLVMPIINGIKASNGEPIHYPISIKFL